MYTLYKHKYHHVGNDDPSHDQSLPQPDTPKREWITSIQTHDCRIDDPDSQFPSLGLYFRCEWSDPKDNISGRTWENEYVFGEGSEMLLDYCRRHHKSIWATINKAQRHNPDMEMNMEATAYLTRAMAEVNQAKRDRAARSQSSQSIPSEGEEPDGIDSMPDGNDTQASSQHYNERTKDELEQMFKDAGGIKSPSKSTKQQRNAKRRAAPDDDEQPHMRAQAIDAVSIKCGEVTMKFDVDEDGRLLKNVQELGHDMGIVGNADMLLFTGRYMADRDDGHFVISQDILNAECTLTLTGQAVEETPGPQNPAFDAATTSYTAPYPDGIENTFMLPHREVPRNTLRCNHHMIVLGQAAFRWLKFKKETKWLASHTPAQRTKWKENVKKRYRLVGDTLMYHKGGRQRANLPATLRTQAVPWVTVLRALDAWNAVVADHIKHHDGHNRAETRLSEQFLIYDVRRLCEHVSKQCQHCFGFNTSLPKVVTPILTTRIMQLVMFDLFFLPIADSEGRTCCIMMIDHFTKFKWARALMGKDAMGIVNFLLSVFEVEGNCERWHCDNGREFINKCVEMARHILKIEGHSTSQPYNPQCNGCVERANGTCKRKILTMSLADGLQNGQLVWNWPRVLAAVVANENNAPLKLYLGLSAFFCMRHRMPDIRAVGVLNPDDTAKVHAFMITRQEIQAGKVLAQHADKMQLYKVDDKVFVKATKKQVKRKQAVSSWTILATIAEVLASGLFYRLRWETTGLGGEKAGELSKRVYHWSHLKMRENQGGNTVRAM